jgi:predicted ArsR family transcriptional regulator
VFESSEFVAPGASVTGPAAERLDVLKALGDNTRYAIYLELARAARPLATSEISDTLGLHTNTVRPHLERMRDVGLLQVEVDARGEVGRPQHRYSLAEAAPSLGFEPPMMPYLASMLVRLAEHAGAVGVDAFEVGREQGRAEAERYLRAPSCIEALVAEMARQGFDPLVEADDRGDTAVIAFAHCPFRSVAEEHHELVCSLHHGIVEGFVDAMGDAEVTDFRTLAHVPSCQVTLASR